MADLSKGRLREITGVLHRHEITKGMTPVKFRQILEDLGPTYIKIGQMMSMRSDLLPREYSRELEQLRANVVPMPMEQVNEVLEHCYGSPVEDVFETFDTKALGSASIAQVHKAVLKNGETVAVKIQRQGIYNLMERDISLLHRAARVFSHVQISELVDLDMVLDEMWSAAKEEMDFLKEADHIEEFYRLNEDVKFISCPKLYREMTSSTVLVMEYVEGYSIEDHTGLEEKGYDRKEIAEKLIDNYIKQITEDGFFHGDPHQGNIRIRDGKIIWLDMGMMGRLSVRDRKLAGQVVEGIAKNDMNQVTDAVIQIGKFHGKVDRNRLCMDIGNLVSQYGMEDFGTIEITSVIEDLMDVMKSHQISMPEGFTMLARGLSTMESLISSTCPEINMISVASARFSENFFQNFDWKKEMKYGGKAVYESAHKAVEIPGLISDMLHMMMKGQAHIDMDLHATDDLTYLMEKMIRRLTTGLLVAALLISSSIVCMTSMKPMVFGVPAIGFGGYMIALFMMLWLFWRHHKKRSGRS